MSAGSSGFWGSTSEGPQAPSRMQSAAASSPDAWLEADSPSRSASPSCQVGRSQCTGCSSEGLV